MTAMMTYSEFLEHAGVKGMKWGVRKDRKSSGTTAKPPKGKLAEVSPEGAITMHKGARIQRVVRRSNGVMLKVGEDLGNNVAYASFSEKDNLIYETSFGKTKGLFNKMPSEVLTLTVNKQLKSPSPAEAVSIYFDTVKKNPAVKEEVISRLPLLYKKADVDMAIEDPNSSRARNLYSVVYDNGNYAKESKANKAFHSELGKKGFNMLLDPSDFSMGYSDTPIVILNPKSSVEITGRREVTKVTQKLANKRLADIERTGAGEMFVEKLKFYD